MQYRNTQLTTAITTFLLHTHPMAARALAAGLLSGVLLLPASESGSRIEELVEINQSRPVSVNLFMKQDSNGKKILMAFTDEAAMQASFDDPCAYIVTMAADTYSFAIQNAIETLVINPNGPVGIVLTLRDLEVLRVISQSEHIAPTAELSFPGAFFLGGVTN